MIIKAKVTQLDPNDKDAKPVTLHDVWRTEANKIKMLAFTPAHPDYGIKPQTIASIQAALTAYDGPVDWMISSGDNPYEHPYDNVVYQDNKARQFALDNGYDALLSIESDMIIPPDTIGQLLKANADVTYGLYVWRHKLARWSAYTTLTLWGGESVSLSPNGNGVSESWGKIIDVVGMGMGCTLIRRAILEKVTFRLHDGRYSWIVDEYADDFKQMGISPYKDLRGMVCDDWLFALDAKHYGFTQRANLGIVCGHIDGDSVLWPDPEADKFYRVDSISEPAGSRVRS